MGTKRLAFSEVAAPAAKTSTEFKKRIRSQAFGDSTIVVAWLNAAKETAAYKRVLSVRAELEVLREMLDALRGERRALALLPKEDPARAMLKEEFRIRHNDLNMLLAKYTFKPALAYSLDTGIWRFATLPNNSRGCEVKVEDENFAVRVNRTTVIAALARLAAGRELKKVHLCDTCQEQWFVAIRRVDKFCSQECRDHYHANSDEYRERKRKTQREYRERLRRNGLA